MNIKNENGITMVALIMTVVLLTILGAFSLNLVNNSTETSEDTKFQFELRMVQQAVLERYTKYTLTKDKDILVGKILTEDTKLPEQLDIFGQRHYTNGILEEENYEKAYYILYNNPNDQNFQYLKKLDIDNTSNVYIANYYTGEVMQVETEIVDVGNQEGREIVKEILNEDSEVSKYLVLKEENGRYILKQTSNGELLYTYSSSNID